MTQQQFSKLYELAIILVSLTIILSPNLTGAAFLLWALVIISGLIFRKCIFIKPSKIGFLFIAFFAAYLIGVFFTNHMDIAMKYLEYKASFLIIPLFFTVQPKNGIRLNSFLNTYVFSVLLLSLYYIVNATFKAYPTFEFSQVSSSAFATTHHPTYFSSYAFFAMLISLNGFFRASSKRRKWVWSGLVVIFLIVQFLSMSLAGILFLMLFFAAFATYMVYRVFRIKGIVMLFIITPLLFIFTLKFIPSINSQFEASKQYLLEYIESPSEFVKSKKTYIGGNETRLIMWTATASEIKENPFGVGTGNVDDHLESRLQKFGHYEMAKKMYNPHNQFLQTFLEIGFFGFFILLTIIAAAVYKGIKERDWLLLSLTLCLAFNSLFESMLQRQSGLVFFTFWVILLTINGPIKKDSLTLKQSN